MTASKPAPSSPAGPGPKPTAPTGPTPTHPPKGSAFTENPPGPPPPLPPPPAPKRGNGHVISDPRGTHPAQAARKACAAAGVGLPALSEVAAAAEQLFTQAINVLNSEWDPRSASADEVWPGMLRDDLQVAKAVSAARTALRELRALTRPTPGPATVPSVAVGESDDAAPRVGAGASPRPWCGASADLGGQQPCPIKTPCGPGECAIGRATGSEVYAPPGTGLHNPGPFATGVAPMAAPFSLPKSPEFSMAAALNTAINRRT